MQIEQASGRQTRYSSKRVGLVWCVLLSSFFPALLATKAEIDFDSGANWVVLQTPTPARYLTNTIHQRRGICCGYVWTVCRGCVCASASMRICLKIIFLPSLFPSTLFCHIYFKHQQKLFMELNKGRQRTDSAIVAPGCGSCFHIKLSNLFDLQGEHHWDKEAKCKCKTSHDRIWQETEISSIPPSGVLLYTLPAIFNLYFNTNPPRLNFDHCHFANLQD